MVQGYMFHNDAVLRCFELITGKEAIRPDIAGLMGFGAALIARSEYLPGHVSALISCDELDGFDFKSSTGRCADALTTAFLL